MTTGRELEEAQNSMSRMIAAERRAVAKPASVADIKQPDEISIVWCIEDVQSIDETISNEDARTILRAIKHGHDAAIGVNWEVIEVYIDLWKEGKLS
jgi:hypothetical protein